MVVSPVLGSKDSWFEPRRSMLQKFLFGKPKSESIYWKKRTPALEQNIRLGALANKMLDSEEKYSILFGVLKKRDNNICFNKII